MLTNLGRPRSYILTVFLHILLALAINIRIKLDVFRLVQIRYQSVFESRALGPVVYLLLMGFVNRFGGSAWDDERMTV